MNASKTLIFTTVMNALDSKKSEILKILQKRSEILEKVLGMPYKIVPPLDGEFGRQRSDGTWTGMVGMVQNNTADLILNIFPNEERSLVLDFSFPYDILPVSFITQKPDIGDKTFTFIQPFTGAVWLASLLSLLLSSLLLHRLLRGRYRFDVVIFNMFRNMLCDSSRIKTVGPAENLLQMTWVVGVMLLAHFYSAVLLSSLSIPTRIGVRNIPELATAVSKGTHQCLTSSGSSVPYTLLKSGKKSFQMIGQNLLENKDDVDSSIMTKGLQRKGVVYILPVDLLNIFRGHYFVSDDNFFHLMGSMAYGKNFCCADKVHTAILRASAAGLFEKLQTERTFQISMSMLLESVGESATTDHKLSLKDLSGAFLLLITGLVFASFVLILEIVSHKILCANWLNKK